MQSNVLHHLTHTHTQTHSSEIMAVPQIQEAQMRHRSIQRLKKKKPTGDLSAAANSQGEEKTNITCHYVLEVLSEGAQLTAEARENLIWFLYAILAGYSLMYHSVNQISENNIQM